MSIYEPYLLDMKTLHNGDIVKHFLLRLNDQLNVGEFIWYMIDENPEDIQSFIANSVHLGKAYQGIAAFCYPEYQEFLAIPIQQVELFEGTNSKDYVITLRKEENKSAS